MHLLLLVILILILLGGGLGWHSGYWTSGGPYVAPLGGLGLVVLVIVLLLLFGVI